MKPILKWPGGKTQLLSVLEKDFPPHITRYAEPFFGGGAFLFYLLEVKLKIRECYLSDINSDLILLYQTIQENLEPLVETLDEVEKKYNSLSLKEKEKLFYSTRASFNLAEKTGHARATQMVFLNRTCFNGLWRVNKAGEFNASFNKGGLTKHTRICYEERLRGINQLFSSVPTKIVFGGYEESLSWIEKDSSNTLIYFDPPYRQTFKSYSNSPFNDKEQLELASYFRKLDSMGCKTLLSNSNCEDDFFSRAYEGFTYETVSAARNINSKGSGRKGSEIIISNYRSLPDPKEYFDI